ncbi:MAG: phosphoglycerate kinase [Solirubrobacterales bacterium]
MAFDRARVQDVEVAGRTALVRVDFNVPLVRGEVTDDTRIRAALPTIQLLLDRGAAVILASHLGRPDGSPDPDLSLEPVARRLTELLSRPVLFCPEATGEQAVRMADGLAPGEVMLLENLRFDPGETANDPAFARDLAALADLYVDDAFGAAHRAHASTEGVAGLLPSSGGLLLQQEVEHLSAVADDPERPLIVVLGGAKVSDKIGVISRFLEIADEILIGGAMCFPFFRAKGIGTGDSLVEEDGISLAADLIASAENPGTRAELVLPVDIAAGESFDAGTERVELDSDSVPEGMLGLDIGEKTAADYGARIGGAGTVLWNGPMGAFELPGFSEGTRVVAEAVASTDAVTVVGGGDSVAALVEFGLTDSIDWVSTGGGASLELLEGVPLPGIEALDGG